MKTSDLTGPALDWAVEKCEGKEVLMMTLWSTRETTFHPSTDWAQGGPIIEREEIGVCRYWNEAGEWIAEGVRCFGKGATPLIAAMRCYVASKLGDEVEIPEELK